MPGPSRTEQSTGESTPGVPRGLLGVPGRLPFRVRRWAAPDDLSWCISHFWVSAWDLLPGRVVTARVLPHAVVNVTLEHGDLVVTGVATGVYSRTLRGRDQAFGIRFAPGAFRLLSAVPVATLSGAGQPASGVLRDAESLRTALTAATDDDARADAAGRWLRATGLRSDTTLDLVQNAHAALVADPGVRRVQQVADRLGVSTRTLQRTFADHLGVSPGWVLRRGRLHAAAERVLQLAAGGAEGGFAEVAAAFGYADQAHFTHEFRRILGAAPGAWSASLVQEHPSQTG